MTPLLRLSGVQKRFGATVALAGVSLDILPGEIHAVVGENGAGKSTLMKILSGVHHADAGTVEFDGKPYAPDDPLEARLAGIVMVNQELAIAPHLSVAENIVLGAEPTRRGLFDWAECRRKAQAALEQLGRADIPLQQPAGTLSVAEQQLVEIARAIALGCRVLVLDEPTSSLTQKDAANLFALVRRLRERGQSVIYISHFLEEVQALADRYTVLRDGQSVATGRIADTTLDEIARHMVGRKVDELYDHPPRTPGEVVVSIEGLAGRTKPTDASLVLHRGEVVGIAGLIGAGRSEFLRSIFGLEEIRSGRLRIATASGAADPSTRWRQGVGFLSEDRKSEGLAIDLPIETNLTLPKLSWRIHPTRLARESGEWIRRLGVRCAGASQRIGDLSGGNQQKIALGRLLRNEAEILLLDEPTRGVDIGAKQNIYRLIHELAASGKAVLIVSSYLPELLGTCDRVAVMCRGVLGPARPVGEWTEHQIMIAATGAASPG